MQSTSTQPSPPQGQHSTFHESVPPPPLTRTSRVVGLLITLVLLGAVGLGIAQRLGVEGQRREVTSAAVAEQRARASAPPEVQVTQPLPFEFEPHYPITGTLDPLQEADVAFNAGGRLQTVNVTLGERVAAGQVLATLDRRSVTAQADLAAASVQASEAALQLAQDRLRRAEALHAQGATSEADLLATRQQVAIAQAQVAQASAQTRLTSTEGSNHLLRAPFAGTVTRVPEGIGSVVMPGQPLFRVEDLSSLVLRSGITERAIARLRIGDTLVLENFPVRGSIRAMAPSLDPVTRRAPIEIAVPNPDGTLVGHALVKGEIVTGRSVPALRIPPTALRGDQTVLVVAANGTIESRPVHAIVDRDGTGVVLDGLEPTDRVVVRPAPDLTVGRTVQPVSMSTAERATP